MPAPNAFVLFLYGTATGQIPMICKKTYAWRVIIQPSAVTMSAWLIQALTELVEPVANE